MRITRLARRVLTTALVMIFATEVPVLAADSTPATTAIAPVVGTTLTGVVRSPGGVPIAGARVSATGPQSASTTTDGTGAFSLTLAPGIYRITVEKGGFRTVSLTDVALVAGQTQPITVALSQADLSSLQTIGSVSTSGRGAASTINTGAATSTYVTAEAFTNLANPQMNDVLQRVPDVTVQHMGSQQDTSIIVGGLQPYETQVLMDGHPLALGQYGVWLSHLFPSYFIGGLETQSGPGNTTAFANIAVGGTVNILTPGYTQRSTAEFTTGIDSYSSQYSNTLITGSAGKLQYVAAGGAGGSNGPYFKKNSCAILEDFAATANSPNSAGIVQFCGDMSGSLFIRGEMLKLKYNFTPSTSFEAGYTGSFGGYSPQGSAWGNALGPTTIEQCMVADPNVCSNPANMNMVGKTVTGYSWYPGTNITNTQQLFTGQFRTSLGTNTLLIRPYIGTIQPESYDGTQEGSYASFWSPQGTVPSLAPGVQIPATGLSNPNSFEANTCPPGTIYSFSQINSPQNTLVAVNGQEECFQYPYVFYEKDKLYGSTLSLIHPLANGYLDFTYDFHGQSTFGYANSPLNVTVPFSANRYSTFSLTGEVGTVRNLNLDFGLYTTHWTLSGEQAKLDVNGNPVLDASGNPVTTGLQRGVSRADPHLALVFRPDRNDAYRAAWGTSETFPFVGDVSGTAAYQPFAQSAPLYTLGIFTEKNPNLQPEYSSAFSLGMDHRFANNGVLSLDLNYTTVHNVFQQLTLAQNTTFNGQTGVLGIFLPINVARMRAQVAQLRYAYAPARGWGYSASIAADRSILDGIPSTAYNSSAGFPVNNVQVCGNGLFTPGLATCIPYLKGYGQLHYTWQDGTFAGLGVEYEGKNNSYYQPPFAQLDLTVRRPLTKNVELQVAVQNLLNTNNFSNLAAPNLGTPVVAETTSGLTSYTPDLIPLPPRTVRFQIRTHLGR